MASRQAELFKVLAGETRIRIIELLKQRGPLCVNDMAEVLGISPSAVSQHLKVLKYAGLVRNERKGYWIPYEVGPVALGECRELLSEVCTCGCEGDEPTCEPKLDGIGDDLAQLREYEGELQKTLTEVKARIEELEERA